MTNHIQFAPTEIPPRDPVYVTRAALVDVIAGGQGIVLQERVEEALPAFDRSARRAVTDPRVEFDIGLLADCLPDSVGDRDARLLASYAVIIGTVADPIRFCLAELQEELRQRWSKPLPPKPARVTSSRRGRST